MTGGSKFLNTQKRKKWKAMANVAEHKIPKTKVNSLHLGI